MFQLEFESVPYQSVKVLQIYSWVIGNYYVSDIYFKHTDILNLIIY